MVGAIHQAESRALSAPARRRKSLAAAKGVRSTASSYATSSSGPARIQPSEAALTPPPADATTSAKAAGHHRLRGEARPRRVATRSQGSAAYASSVMLV